MAFFQVKDIKDNVDSILHQSLRPLPDLISMAG